MRCPTTSGRYQCNRELDANGVHDGDCEAEDLAQPTIGPYTDGFRARAYLRGMLDVTSGSALDAVGERLNVRRVAGEDDCAYRERIWSKR